MTVRDHLLVAHRARWRKGRLWRDLCNLSKPTTEESGKVDAVLEQWRFSFVSRAAERVFGWKAKEVIGRTV